MLNKNLILSILLLFTTYSFAGNINKEKPKYLWFDAEANFERFSSKDSISYYLEKAKDVGFNQVVVDVKPIYGEVLYKTSNPQLSSSASFLRLNVLSSLN